MTICRGQVLWSRISRKWLEIEAWLQKDTNRNGIWEIVWTRDRWHHVTCKCKGQGRDADIKTQKQLQEQPSWPLGTRKRVQKSPVFRL